MKKTARKILEILINIVNSDEKTDYQKEIKQIENYPFKFEKIDFQNLKDGFELFIAHQNLILLIAHLQISINDRESKIVVRKSSSILPLLFWLAGVKNITKCEVCQNFMIGYTNHKRLTCGITCRQKKRRLKNNFKEFWEKSFKK